MRKSMKKREIDNIDPNKAFYLLQLQQAALIYNISAHKSYQGHIVSFSVSRILKRHNLG